MDVYISEQEQVEAIRSWWTENGKSVIFGIVLGLAAIFGWREWQSYKINQSITASDLFQEVIVSLQQNQIQEAKDPANEVIRNYEKTGYAILNRLILAQLAVADNDYSPAEEHLLWALDNTQNESLLHEIRVRLIRVYIAEKKFDEALSLLTESNQGVFKSIYEELRGDIYVLQGKINEARTSYLQAIELSNSSSVDLTFLNMKLNDLGR